MIQFNLLPDVKLEYIRTRRTKRSVVSISLLVTGIALFIFLFLVISVDVFQKKNISDLNTDIHTYSTKLQSTPDINKILTIQNQLQALPAMHDKKVVASRMFGYVQSVTPAQAFISDFKIDFTKNSIFVTGQGPSLDVINTFIDTLKFTQYSTTDGANKNKAAFSSVVLSGFSRDNKTANYTITANFDPIIFSNASTVNLTVPAKTTTRSEVDQPKLFEGGSTTTTKSTGN
jgi:hypothetical protein